MATDDLGEPHVVRCGPLYQLAQERYGGWRLWVDGTTYHHQGAATMIGAILNATRWLEEAFGIDSRIGPWSAPKPKTGG